MYKDVWKKILAVFLTVAVIAGLVELPKVANAAVPAGLTVEVATVEYNGEEQTPLVTITDNNTGREISANTYNVIPTQASMVEVGTYEIKIVPESGLYTWGTFTTEFRIREREAYDIVVEPEALFVQKTDSDTYTVDDLGIENVYVILSDGNREQLQRDTVSGNGYPGNGYAVSSITLAPGKTTGKNIGSYTIKVHTPNLANEEFTNNKFTVASKLDVSFDLAPEVGATVVGGVTCIPYRKGLSAFQESASSTLLSGLKLKRTTGTYLDLLSRTYSGMTVEFYNYNISSKTRGTQITPSAITDAGEYLAVVTTGRGSFDYNSELYAGTVELPFKVVAKDIEALDEKTAIIDKVTGQYLYHVEGGVAKQDYIPELTYNDGQPVYYGPTNFELSYEGKQLDTSDYTINYLPADRVSKVGTITVSITGNGNYKGNITFEYRIMSDLAIVFNEGANFTPGTAGVAAKKTYKYPNTKDIPNFSVVNKAGIEVGYYSANEGLVDNGKFTVTYQYYDDEQEAFVDTADTASDEFTRAGLKQITVTGKANTEYANSAPVTMVFEVEPVSLTNTTRINLTKDASKPYTGSPIEDITLSLVDRTLLYTLVKGTDYDVVFTNNTNVTDSARFVITGKGNYKDEISGTFKITKVNLSGAVVDPEDYTYTGSRIYPTIKVNGNVVYDAAKADSDEYDVIIDDGYATWDGISVMDHIKVLVRANTNTQNYTGSATLYFNVTKASSFSLLFDGKTCDEFNANPPEVEWNGKTTEGTKIAAPVVTGLDGAVMEAGTDYIISWGVNTGNPADFVPAASDYVTANIAIVPVNSNYSPIPLVLDYRIKKRDISHCANLITYTGVSKTGATVTVGGIEYAAWRPDGIEVSDDETGVLANTYYDIDCSDDKTKTDDNDCVTGERGYIEITGKGGYTGTLAGASGKSFPCGYNISEATIVTSVKDREYTFEDGVAFPANEADLVSLAFNGNPMANDADYKISLSTTSPKYQDGWTSDEIRKHAGTITVKLTGMGDYYGERTFNYTIKPRPISRTNVTITFDDIASPNWNDMITFKGREITPDVTVNFGTLPVVEGQDYELVWSDNIYAFKATGKQATVTVRGIGDYATNDDDPAKATFKILQRKLDEDVIIVLDYNTCVYAGTSYMPGVTMNYDSYKLGGGKNSSYQYLDFTTKRDLTISDNIRVGTWSGQDPLYFDTWNDADIANAANHYGRSECVETTYDDGTKSKGGGHVIIQATSNGNFTGYAVAYFDITRIDFNAGTLVSDLTDAELDNSTPKPDVSKYSFWFTSEEQTSPYHKAMNRVELTSADIGTVTYVEGSGAGQHELSIDGAGNFTGTATIYYTIYNDIQSIATVKLSGTYFNNIVTVSGNSVSGTISQPKLLAALEADPEAKSLVQVLVKQNGNTLRAENYTVSITSTEVGEASLIVSGNRESFYKGEVVIKIIITGDLATAEISPITDQLYTGAQIRPAVIVKNGRTILKGGLEANDPKNGTWSYYVTYGENIKTGKDSGQVTVTGIAGTPYEGSSQTVYFNILFPLDKTVVRVTYGTDTYEITANDVSYKIVNGARGAEEYLSIEYDGTQKKPDATLYYNYGTETAPDLEPVPTNTYAVTYGNNVAATETGKIYIRPDTTSAECLLSTKNSSVRTINFIITPAVITEDYFSMTAEKAGPAFEYTGSQIRPAFVVRNAGNVELVEGTDFTAEFGRNTAVTTDEYSKGSISIKGKGNYQGEFTKKFDIVAADISSSKFTTDESVTVSYTGRDLLKTDIPANMVYLDFFGARHELLSYDQDNIDGAYEITAYLENGTKKTGMPKDVGTYYLFLEGCGPNYTGARQLKLIIVPHDIEEEDIFVQLGTGSGDSFAEQYDWEYMGSGIKPDFRVLQYYQGETTPVDITGNFIAQDYANNVNVPAADAPDDERPYVTVRGQGNYTGTKRVWFNIIPRTLNASNIKITFDYGEKGEKKDYWIDSAGDIHMVWVDEDTVKQPVITVVDTTTQNAGGGRTTTTLNLWDDATGAGDYVVKFDSQYDNGECKKAGRVEVVITGKNNYAGYEDNYNAGANTTYVLKDNSSYTGKPYIYFIGVDLSNAEISLAGSNSMIYDGLYADVNESRFSVRGLTTDSFKLKVYKDSIFTDSSRTTLNEEGVVDLDKMIDAATYYITVDGCPEKGTYAAKPVNSATYIINPKSISNVTISGYPETVYYTGEGVSVKAITVVDPELPIRRGTPQYRKEQLTEGKDYNITNNGQYTGPGKAEITIQGIGNYKGTAHAWYTIEANTISGGDTDDGTSSGTGITKDGVTIDAKDIQLYYTGDDYMLWTGKEVIPNAYIVYRGGTLHSGTDFTATATNNINAGVATLILTGKNGFSGTLTKKFIIKADLSKATIAAIPDQSYTGNELTPSLTVRCGGNVLSERSDYNAVYSNNVNVGKAKVELTALSDSYYYGSTTANFNISNGAPGMSVTGYSSSYVYTGYAISPDLIVTMDGVLLTPGVDYKVTYSNNINVGTATATVTGTGKYSGTKTISYTIQAKNISTCNAYVSGGNAYEYTGNSQTPTVTIKDVISGKTLTNGTDYSISYSNNTDPGTATVTIKALSKNYTGVKTVTFAIASASVTGLKASNVTYKSMKLAWEKQAYADGYQICDQNNRVVANTKNNSYKIGGLTSYKTYKFKVRSYVENADGSIAYGGFSQVVSKRTKLGTPTLKVKAVGNGKVKLTWSKTRLATGYEIYYSTKKNGVYTKLKTRSASSSRAWNDTGLAKNEKYYYTVRAYRRVNGNKIYSNYSAIKCVSVK